MKTPRCWRVIFIDAVTKCLNTRLTAAFYAQMRTLLVLKSAKLQRRVSVISSHFRNDWEADAAAEVALMGR